MLALLWIWRILLQVAGENVHLIPFNTKHALQAEGTSLFVSYKSVREQSGNALLFNLNGEYVKSDKHAILVATCGSEPPVTSITSFQTFLMENCQSVTLIDHSHNPCLGFPSFSTSFSTTIVSVIYIESPLEVVEFEASAFKNFLVASVQNSCSAIRSNIDIQRDPAYRDYTVSSDGSDVSLGTLGIGCRALGVWQDGQLLSTSNHVTLSASSQLTVRCVADPGAVSPPALFFASNGEFAVSYANSSFTPDVTAAWPYVCVANNSEAIASVRSRLNVSSILTNPAPATLTTCPSDLASVPNCGGVLFPLLSGGPLTLPEGSAVVLGSELDTLFLSSDFKTCAELSIIDTEPQSTLKVALFAAPAGHILLSSPRLSLSCPYTGETGVTALMFRTHTHSHDSTVSMWVERGSHWIPLISSNTPDHITVLSERARILPGDTLHVECEYSNLPDNSSLLIGPDREMQEMCNLYLYYLRDSTERADIGNCFTMAEFSVPDVTEASAAALARDPFAAGPALTFDRVEKREGGELAVVALSSRSDLLYSLSLNLSVNLTIALQTGRWGVIEGDVLGMENITSNSSLPNSGGGRFYLPSGLSVSSTGGVLITDLILHQVFLFNSAPLPPSSTEPTLVLGEAFTPGNDTGNFCRPTAALMDDVGFIYVADGLCGGRIVKFGSDGTFLASFGVPGTDRGVLGVFGEVKDLALDSRRHLLLVLDDSLLQLTVLETTGRGVRLFDLKRYLSLDAVTYSVEMDAIVILSCYGLECQVAVLEPVEGTELSLTPVGETHHLTSLTTLPGNRLVVGTQTNQLLFYHGHPGTTIQDKGEMRDVSPLIHYYLPPSGSLNGTSDGFLKSHRWSLGLAVVLIGLVVAVVGVVLWRVQRGRGSGEYQTLQESESDSEDVLYRSNVRRRSRETFGL